MKKTRLEAFSDGVMAIIITIMVLELKIPASHDLQALIPLCPVFLSYLLSFVYIGIYWNNHHHMLYAVEHINGKVLWANLNLLFWLSVVPFVTGWMGESHFSKWPIVLYGASLLMCAISYTILARILVKITGPHSALAQAVGDDWKGKISIVIYIVAMAASLYCSWVGLGLYGVVAIIWFIPDTRIEHKISKIERE